VKARASSSSGNDDERATATKQQDDAAAPATPSAAPSADGGLATSAAQWVAEVVASPVFYLVAGLAAVKLIASTGEEWLPIFLFAVRFFVECVRVCVLRCTAKRYRLAA
jgi:hypothetical protein